MILNLYCFAGLNCYDCQRRRGRKIEMKDPPKKLLHKLGVSFLMRCTKLNMKY